VRNSFGNKGDAVTPEQCEGFKKIKIRIGLHSNNTVKEFKVIVNEYKKINLGLRKAALATVVRVRGSSYRSPGARMLIRMTADGLGQSAGAVLKAMHYEKRGKVMNDQKPITVTYDTNEESNQNLGINLDAMALSMY